jgi:hypothetical protein
MKKREHKFLWCPSDDHGDHEIDLRFVIHPGNDASLDGPAVDAEIEIVSATEGGVDRLLAPHEEALAVIAIAEGFEQ